MNTHSPAPSKSRLSLGNLLLLAVAPIAFGACAVTPSRTAIRDAATATQYAGAAAQIYSDVNAAQEAAQAPAQPQTDDQSSAPAPDSSTDAAVQAMAQSMQQAGANLQQANENLQQTSAILSRPR